MENKKNSAALLTYAVAEVILVPPAAPTTSRTWPSLTTIVGTIDDKGLFPGFIKLASDGGIPKAFVILGAEKSSISSFKIIPVDSEM